MVCVLILETHCLCMWYSETNPELGMSIGLEFQISMYSISGLKVDSLRLFRESYKPYKVKMHLLSLSYVLVLIVIHKL